LFINFSSKKEDVVYLARWIALYEAINMIADEALSRKKEFNKLKLSPVKIKKYISSVEDHIQKKLLEDDLKSNIINNNFISKESYKI
jgi:hypothetical protein